MIMSDDTQQKGEESAELFEDENEQFIKALEKAPEKTEASAVTLDQILPEKSGSEIQEDQKEKTEDAPKTETVSEAAPGDVADKKEAMTHLSQVPVSIQLELGRVSCCLQKLIDLRENDLLELTQPLGQVIDLRVEGRLIGRGQIVRLGDQLGLRVSELAGR